MNELYDSLRVKNNFRFGDTFTCEGSFNGAVATNTPLTITHPESGVLIDVNQVPGAEVAYLYLRRACFSHNITVAANFSVLTLDYQTMGGALVGLCIYDTRDFSEFFNIDKLINEPITNSNLVSLATGVPTAGGLVAAVDALATGGTIFYQLTFAVAYQITPANESQFYLDRLAGIEQKLDSLLAVKAEVS